jgi:hypothetical protein
MKKIQLILTPQEVDLFQAYGDQFGYNLTRTIKFFISKAAEEIINSGIIPNNIFNQKLKEIKAKIERQSNGSL